MMRLTLAPTAIRSADLLDLPWSEPLESWADERLVKPRHEGIHRHVVRFMEDGGQLWAIKELPEEFALREYRILLHLLDLGIPCVPVQAVVADRAAGLEAALITGYLEYSSTYRALFSEPRGLHSRQRLLDALVQLLARLHLAGIYWGDCSLSNTLFRLDAGQLAAYLVDAETAELHPELSNGQRETDVLMAGENIAGELLDLEAGGLLSADVDPLEVVSRMEDGYEALWDELTGEWLIPIGEVSQRVAKRVRCLNELGFDLEEIELDDAGPDRVRLRVTTRVSEPGHHRQLLYRRTGLVAEENQARRLLDDIASFRAMLERRSGRPVSRVVAANRWLEEVYDPVIVSIPTRLRDKLDPVEVFHEVLEHRWYLSEQAGHDVGTAAATASYLANILPAVPDGLTSGRAPDLERTQP
jgi:tRNA A-37 threonylcarbamoyl transferase component Bud32